MDIVMRGVKGILNDIASQASNNSGWGHHADCE